MIWSFVRIDLLDCAIAFCRRHISRLQNFVFRKSRDGRRGHQTIETLWTAESVNNVNLPIKDSHTVRLPKQLDASITSNSCPKNITSHITAVVRLTICLFVLWSFKVRNLVVQLNINNCPEMLSFFLFDSF